MGTLSNEKENKTSEWSKHISPAEEQTYVNACKLTNAYNLVTNGEKQKWLRENP